MKIETTTQIDIDEADVLQIIKDHVSSLGYQINELKQDGLSFHIKAEPTTAPLNRPAYRRKEAGNQDPASPLSTTGKTVQ